MRNAKMLFFALVALAISCKPIYDPVDDLQPTPTGQPQIIAVKGDVIAQNTIILCGVTIGWNYVDQNIRFTNHNDQDARVTIFPGVWRDIPPNSDTVEDVLTAHSVIARGYNKLVIVELSEKIGPSVRVPTKTCREKYVLGK
jgi:hypothetical protein